MQLSSKTIAWRIKIWCSISYFHTGLGIEQQFSSHYGNTNFPPINKCHTVVPPVSHTTHTHVHLVIAQLLYCLPWWTSSHYPTRQSRWSLNFLPTSGISQHADEPVKCYHIIWTNHFITLPLLHWVLLVQLSDGFLLQLLPPLQLQMNRYV